MVLYTRSMSCITELHKYHYINKTKIIKLSIYNDLTFVALAHWIMGHGTFNGITLHWLLFDKRGSTVNKCTNNKI